MLLSDDANALGQWLACLWQPCICNEKGFLLLKAQHAHLIASRSQLPCWATCSAQGLIFIITLFKVRSATSVSCATWARSQ